MPPDKDDCCCWKILFNQPDFISQKSELQELVGNCGHLCDFYPKYHWELNFIEQYWGAAKLSDCKAGRATTLDDLKKVLASLDGMSIDKICQCAQTFLDLITTCSLVDRYANCSAWFIDAYRGGLTSAEAAWANKKYHTLPPDMIREVKNSILSWGNFVLYFYLCSSLAIWRERMMVVLCRNGVTPLLSTLSPITSILLSMPKFRQLSGLLCQLPANILSMFVIVTKSSESLEKLS